MKNKIAIMLVCIAISGCLFACGSDPVNRNSGNDTAVTQPSGEYETPEVNENEIPPEEEKPTVAPVPEVPPAQEPKDPHAQDPPQVEYDTLIASTASLNVRSGPATSYAIIGSLDKNDMAQPLGLDDGWYKIRYDNKIGYVSAKYVTTVDFIKSNEEIESIIEEGKKLLGIPYEYGAQRYHNGNGSLNKNYDGKSYDCSSLMQYIFKKGANVNLAMTSREQSLQGTTVEKADIRRGDLLFFTNESRKDKTGLERIGHVALYLGDNVILHTASDHAVIEPISTVRNSYFITAKRFF